jgi:hypothetical protein
MAARVAPGRDPAQQFMNLDGAVRPEPNGKKNINV